jgi:arginine decarboxylase
MVPGQAITRETIDFMRKLDVREIDGYDAVEGLKLVRAEALPMRIDTPAQRAA